MPHPFARTAVDSLPDNQTSQVVGGQQDDKLTHTDTSKATLIKTNDRIVGPPVFYTQALGEDGGFVPPTSKL
ncbi:hypothetical protein QTP81_12025 [Alteromonas sp. ASW11-36]|uniref:Uncharacterized protein n=1 Tax=Alteromonas arenosi TaxID=3055817 RepID=A0ABT7SYQ5_9ALTE|nr:hypothetical protein [Alteromonas sp. ASW11-36]MDM7861324.1 hypothetical protein [Alteromonas sp. ASW11-36]